MFVPKILKRDTDPFILRISICLFFKGSGHLEERSEGVYFCGLVITGKMDSKGFGIVYW